MLFSFCFVLFILLLINGTRLNDGKWALPLRGRLEEVIGWCFLTGMVISICEWAVRNMI